MKKRLFSAILALVLALTLLPITGLATESGEPDVVQENSAWGPIYYESAGLPGLPDPGNGSPVTEEMMEAASSLHLGPTGATDKEAAKAVILAGLQERQASINVSACQINRADIFNYYVEVLGEHPELFYAMRELRWSYNSSDIVLNITPLYQHSSDEEIQRFYDTADAVVAQVDPNWSDEQKLLFLHDYLVTHCDYDTTHTYHCAYDALVDGCSVCEGYANAYRYLTGLVGIEALYISSDALNHAWNLVHLSSGDYYIDCTWDDPVDNRYEAYCEHTNFLRSRNGMYETGHNRTDWMTTYNVNAYTNLPGSTAYDNAWWLPVLTAIPMIGNTCAYAKPTDQNNIYLRTGLFDAETTVPLDDSARWHVWDSGTAYYATSYISVTAMNGTFYFSEPDTFWSLTTAGQIEKVYTLSAEEKEVGYIYGVLKQTDSSLIYNLGTAPYGVTYEQWALSFNNPTSGTCGPNATWTWTEDGVLTISGTGPMWDYEYVTDVPWRSHVDEIADIVVGDGITEIGNGAFSDISLLTSASLPASVTRIGAYSFHRSGLQSISIPASVVAIDDFAFVACGELTDVYYGGTQAQWNAISIGQGNDELLWATLHPTVPTGPVMIGAEATNAGIVTTWDAFPDADRYTVYRKADGDTKWTNLGKTTGTTFTDPNVVAGTTYWYMVRAVKDNAFIGTYDKVGVSATAIPVGPTGPVMIGAEATAAGIVASWDAFPNADRYTVYRKTADTKWASIGKAYGTTFTDPNVVAGTTYWYMVRAVKDGAFIGTYDKVGVSATAIAPTGPVMISAQATKSGIVTTWTAFEGADRYTVYRKTADTKWASIGKAYDTTFTDPNVVAGTTYWYMVRAVKDGAFIGTYDKVGVSATAIAVTPAAPVLIGAEATGAGIVFSWEAYPDADRYTVYRKTAGASWTNLGKAYGTSFTDPNVVAGTTYWYTVRPVKNNDFIGGYDKTGVSATAIPIVPTGPVMIDAQATATGIVASCEALPAADRYPVYRKADGDTKWTNLGKAYDTSYTDTTGVAGTTYWYMVRAVKDNAFIGTYDKVGVSATFPG